MGKKSTSEKASYVFLRWEPALEPVQSNTTYTAMFQGTILSPMKLRLAGSAVESDVSGATITATLGDYSTPAVGFSAGIGAALRDHTRVVGSASGAAAVAVPSVTATFTELQSGRGYDWTLCATQWIATANMADVGGKPLAYYAWNGAKWVLLKGAIAKLGEPVELLGVIDFAIKGGTMTWYADGAQLTDEDGNWAIPMSLGPLGPLVLADAPWARPLRRPPKLASARTVFEKP